MRLLRRAARAVTATAVLTASVVIPVLTAQSASADTCPAGDNATVCENLQTGTPMTDWLESNHYGDIEAFATNENSSASSGSSISVTAGQTLHFKVSSPSSSYTARAFRLGYYGGAGARQITTFPSGTHAAISQSAHPCVSSTTTGLVDCGTWTDGFTWTVPAGTPSGVYVVDFDQTDGNGNIPCVFVVRDPSSHADIVFQTDDETWEAYNSYGGQDLYDGSGPALDGRAYQVSYNRPFDMTGNNNWLGAQFAMIYWLEENGYDVTYVTGGDVAADNVNGNTLLNHKVFMSSGHDEYWQGQQRANVQNAVDHGVNAMFLSGNEMFWKTQLAPSVDGKNTTNATLVVYKETKMEQPTVNGIPNPSGQWTGTWRDPHPTISETGGGQPENALTGTLFMANGYRADALTVPAAYAKYRIWRNTSITNLTGNQVATFPTGTLGYEWDVDMPTGNTVSNSQRPPGNIDLSSTTVNITNGTLLLDQGNSYGNGTATHSLVEYRDPISNALVFGAGTVQWSWGLAGTYVDNQGNTFSNTVDSRMQQATVNVLADMGVQPQTIQSNLTKTSQSTDTTGPAVTITSPSAGTSVPVLKPVTVKGTAADLGGGQLAAVQVSTDGGTTWNPATGLANWTYTFTPSAQGALTVKVRGIDDSANPGTPANLALTVGQQQCPCTVFPSTAVPTTQSSGDPSAVELGMRITPSTNGYITGVKFYKYTANTGTHVGHLWSASGTLLGAGTFTNETASGWQTMTFTTPIPVRANTTYVVSYYAPSGYYSGDTGYFTNNGAGQAPLTAPQSTSSSPNGLYHYGTGGGFPNQSYNAANYWVDAVFDNTSVDNTAPTVSSHTPAAGATGVAANTPITATFSKPVDSSTLQFTVTDTNGHAVPGGVAYDAATNTATFTPNNTLTLSTGYTVSVNASDSFGNAMTSPAMWGFTTSSTPPPVNCPCSVFRSSQAPASSAPVSDPSSVELGMRFTPSVSGYVTGVKFWKDASNTGAHTGTLWSATGQQLATGTFTGETASGWQTLTFANPVAVQANTTYVVSYHAPNGEYSSDPAFFASGVGAYPLTAPADSADGHNGLYAYGSGTVFPSNSYNANNYWVDVVFNTSPTVTATAPTAGATGVSTTAAITATFNGPVQPSSLSFTVTGPSGAVAGSTTYDAGSNTATFTPSAALAANTAYTASVTATGTSGLAMITPYTWSFTTGAGAGHAAVQAPSTATPTGSPTPSQTPTTPTLPPVTTSATPTPTASAGRRRNRRPNPES